jgi:hypothetical protein
LQINTKDAKIFPMSKDSAHYNKNLQNASLKLPKAILSTDRNRQQATGNRQQATGNRQQAIIHIL